VTQPGQIQLQVQPAAEQVIYSDVVAVNGAATGFVLNFGQMGEPGVIRVYSRIGMSPNHLKMLARLLQQNVEGYEAKFGEIPVGDGPQAPHHHIGFEPRKD
jgi:hypothetical protein